MPKTIYPSLPQYKGHVILHDPMTYAMVKAIENAQDAAAELKPSSLLSKKDAEGNVTLELYWTSDTDHLRLEALFACVKEWHIEGLPEPLDEGNFPMTPRQQVTEFLSWIWDEMYKIYRGEIDIPNAS